MLEWERRLADQASTNLNHSRLIDAPSAKAPWHQKLVDHRPGDVIPSLAIQFPVDNYDGIHVHRWEILSDDIVGHYTYRAR